MRYLIQPRAKGISGIDSTTLTEYHDTQTVSTDNLSGGRLAFFPPQESGSRADANYQKNPLPRDRSYNVLGLGLGFNLASLEVTPADQANIDLFAMWNAILNGRMVFETGKQTELLDRHIKEVLAYEDAALDIIGSDDGGTGDGFARAIDFPPGLAYRLDEPLLLESQEKWTLDVEFADTTAIPSDADWTSFSGSAQELRMIATLFIAFRD